MRALCCVWVCECVSVWESERTDVIVCGSVCLWVSIYNYCVCVCVCVRVCVLYDSQAAEGDGSLSVSVSIFTLPRLPWLTAYSPDRHAYRQTQTHTHTHTHTHTYIKLALDTHILGHTKLSHRSEIRLFYKAGILLYVFAVLCQFIGVWKDQVLRTAEQGTY